MKYLIDVIDGIDWDESPVSKAHRGSFCNELSTDRSVNAGKYVWYDPSLRDVIDEGNEHSRAAAVLVQEPELPHDFVFVDDASVDYKIANQGNTPIVTTFGAPVVVDTSMDDVPMPMPSLDSVGLELATVSAFLERAGVP